MPTWRNFSRHPWPCRQTQWRGWKRSSGDAEGEPTVLGGGITNHNFRARFGGRDVVVRLPGNDTELLGSDRSGERQANSPAAAAGVAPAVLAHLEDPLVLVTAFVEGPTMEPAELRAP